MADSRIIPVPKGSLREFMEKMNLLACPNGYCFPFSLLAIQAYLVNRIDRFDKRFDDIRRLNDLNQIPYLWNADGSKNLSMWDADGINVKPDILELHVFCRCLVALGEPHRFSGKRLISQLEGLEQYFSALCRCLVALGEPHRFSGKPLISPLEGMEQYFSALLCEALDNEAKDPADRVHFPMHFTGAYSRAELNKYFESLAHAIKKSGANPRHPFTMQLNSTLHSIAVAYDVNKRCWMFTDIRNENLQTRYFRSAQEIADAVNQTFEDGDATIFSTTVFSTRPELPEITKIINYWQNDSTFQSLHKVIRITPEGVINKATWKDGDSSNWLSVAVREGDIVKARELLANGADPNLPRNKDGLTPLMFAANENKADMAQLLLEHGAKASIDQPETEEGKTALYMAVVAGNIEVVKVLLAAGANVNQPCNAKNQKPLDVEDKKRTPLYVAVLNGHADIVELLLTAGADPNIPDYAGRTPLGLAALNGKDECAEKLLACGRTAVDVADNKGKTPLYYAAELGRYHIADLLLQRRANPVSVTNEDYTPLQIAKFNRRYDIETLICHYRYTPGFFPAAQPSAQVEAPAPRSRCCTIL